MAYIDGFVVAVPSINKEQYKAYAKQCIDTFKQEYGALACKECWGDDVPEGELTSFPLAVKAQDDETVVFSWITRPSKEVRDIGMQKCMQDPRFDPLKSPMPFDGKRMIYGGFEVLVDE
ncbi:MAG: DUF1428 domain-containing protein [Paraglaciecola polaris]|uniref:DUF1428 domain-containing protein n=1 Tax=Paraglaciecola polaris TaxID=222814 RepID=UPI00300200B5